MKNVKALKDPYHRRAANIDSNNHPAGAVDLNDEELKKVDGAGTPAGAIIASFRFCHHAVKALPAVAGGVRWAWKKIWG